MYWIVFALFITVELFADLIFGFWWVGYLLVHDNNGTINSKSKNEKGIVSLSRWYTWGWLWFIWKQWSQVWVFSNTNPIPQWNPVSFLVLDCVNLQWVVFNFSFINLIWESGIVSFQVSFLLWTQDNLYAVASVASFKGIMKDTSFCLVPILL